MRVSPCPHSLCLQTLLGLGESKQEEAKEVGALPGSPLIQQPPPPAQQTPARWTGSIHPQGIATDKKNRCMTSDDRV